MSYSVSAPPECSTWNFQVRDKLASTHLRGEKGRITRATGTGYTQAAIVFSLSVIRSITRRTRGRWDFWYERFSVFRSRKLHFRGMPPRSVPPLLETLPVLQFPMPVRLSRQG